MKLCFLVNPAPLIIEFFGKLAEAISQKGDEYIIVANSKIAEYDKKKYFLPDAKILSEVDWCIKNYQKDKKEFPNLSWKEFFPEFERFNRFKLYNFNYHNSAEIVAQSYQFADFIFQKEKPDIIIAEPPTGIFDEVFYLLSKKYKAKYLGFIVSRIKNRIDIYDFKYTFFKYEETFKKLNINNISKKEKKFAQEFIKKFIIHKHLPSYMDFQREHWKKSQLKKILGYLKREKKMVNHYLKYLSKRKYFKPFDYNSEFLIKYIPRYPWEALKRKFRKFFQRNIFNFLDNNDKYFLFPLQLQPEASTSVQATYFCDQLNTIRNIAFSLPFPYKLYIKEHPSAKGTQPGNFYREIKKIPNAVLISPNENVENLIEKSQGVITLTSTIGMEAVLSGKPAYIIGNVFYQYHPLCRKVNSFEELKKRLKQDLAKKPVLKNLDDVNIRFVTSYSRNTVPGNIVSASRKNDTNDYKEIYKNIKRMFFENEK